MKFGGYILHSITLLWIHKSWKSIEENYWFTLLFVDFLGHCYLLEIANINQSYTHVFGFSRGIDWCTNHWNSPLKSVLLDFSFISLGHCYLLGIARINQSYIHVFVFSREIDWCTNHWNSPWKSADILDFCKNISLHLQAKPMRGEKRKLRDIISI